VDDVRARHVGETVLVVGHRATNRALLGLLLGLPVADSLAFKPKHDVVLEIQPGGEPACREHRYAPVAESKGSEP
jgi:broad specificity phosphatase PhoE